MILLDKETGKERIEDNLFNIKRTLEVVCCKCFEEVQLVEDSEEECRETLIDELKWNVVETSEGDIDFVCEDCSLTI